MTMAINLSKWGKVDSHEQWAAEEAHQWMDQIEDKSGAEITDLLQDPQNLEETIGQIESFQDELYQELEGLVKILPGRVFDYSNDGETNVPKDINKSNIWNVVVDIRKENRELPFKEIASKAKALIYGEYKENITKVYDYRFAIYSSSFMSLWFYKQMKDTYKRNYDKALEVGDRFIKLLQNAEKKYIWQFDFTNRIQQSREMIDIMKERFTDHLSTPDWSWAVLKRKRPDRAVA